MSQKKRQFTKEFKLQFVCEIEASKSVTQAARAHEIHLTIIGRWRKQNSQYGERAVAGNGNTYKDEARIAGLERMVGQFTMENALLR
jgi:transposase